jgi:hypothetical protein
MVHNYTGTPIAPPLENGLGRLQVQNPDLSGTYSQFSFVAGWYMLHYPSGAPFFQAGWSENSWTGDRRHVFTYGTHDSQWPFYDQYQLVDGQSYSFEVDNNEYCLSFVAPYHQWRVWYCS